MRDVRMKFVKHIEFKFAYGCSTHYLQNLSMDMTKTLSF